MIPSSLEDGSSWWGICGGLTIASKSSFSNIIGMRQFCGGVVEGTLELRHFSYSTTSRLELIREGQLLRVMCVKVCRDVNAVKEFDLVDCNHERCGFLAGKDEK
mmetsp:Transcript_676/g.1262  ORF Transcript_676/g.1262 Transcript_676/m.1262 type:complete len:104 (+) Transcript_676:439-750(+)